MSVSDSMQISLFGKVQGNDFTVASREGICMSFVILLIHPVLVAGRVSLCHFPMSWKGGSLVPHSMSACQYEKALLARGDSKQGNDQSRVMIWQRKGKTMRREKEDAGWSGLWDGEHGCGWGQPLASCISCAGFCSFVEPEL